MGHLQCLRLRWALQCSPNWEFERQRMPWKLSRENEHHPGESCKEWNALGEAHLTAWSAPECSNLYMTVPMRG